MYVDKSVTRQKDKTYTRYLLRECYREGRKIKHRTIANLSKCSPKEIKAIRLALKNKKDLSQLGSQIKPVSVKQGLSVGAVWLIYDIVRKLGMADALGAIRQGLRAPASFSMAATS